MAHDHESLDILTDDDPRETLDWWLAVVSAAVTYLLLGWWAPRTWWTALNAHPGHGLNVARSPRRRHL